MNTESTYTVKYPTVNGRTYAQVTGGTRTRAHMLKVEKTRMDTPSNSRSGAYQDAFIVTARGEQFRRPTRKAAVAAAVASLRFRGFDI